MAGCFLRVSRTLADRPGRWKCPIGRNGVWPKCIRCDVPARSHGFAVFLPGVRGAGARIPGDAGLSHAVARGTFDAGPDAPARDRAGGGRAAGVGPGAGAAGGRPLVHARRGTRLDACGRVVAGLWLLLRLVGSPAIPPRTRAAVPPAPCPWSCRVSRRAIPVVTGPGGSRALRWGVHGTRHGHGREPVPTACASCREASTPSLFLTMGSSTGGPRDLRDAGPFSSPGSGPGVECVPGQDAHDAPVHRAGRDADSARVALRPCSPLRLRSVTETAGIRCRLGTSASWPRTVPRPSGTGHWLCVVPRVARSAVRPWLSASAQWRFLTGEKTAERL